MKVILILLLSSTCYGQTYDEWARQRETQKKYLSEQILALKTFAGYAQQGYSIAKTGLHAVRDIKNGDFSLHDDFFNSLLAVTPSVKSYARIATIISIQLSVAKQFRNAAGYAKHLTGGELRYINSVFENVLEEGTKCLDQLFAVITDGGLQMTDDERIMVIDNLYALMKEKQVFLQSFGTAVKTLCVQRLKEKYSIQIEKKLNGLQ